MPLQGFWGGCGTSRVSRQHWRAWPQRSQEATVDRSKYNALVAVPSISHLVCPLEIKERKKEMKRFFCVTKKPRNWSRYHGDGNGQGGGIRWGWAVVDHSGLSPGAEADAGFTKGPCTPRPLHPQELELGADVRSTPAGRDSTVSRTSLLPRKTAYSWEKLGGGCVSGLGLERGKGEGKEGLERSVFTQYARREQKQRNKVCVWGGGW